MRWYVSGFVLMAIVGGAVLADEKTDAEMKKLEGTWEVESFEIMGKKIPAPKGQGGSVVFDKDMKLVMTGPGKPKQSGKYKIDVGKSPKQIDLIELKDGKEGKTTEAIYEVDSDKLKLGFSQDGPKGKRPSDFKGDKVAIMYLKRQKS